MAPPTDDTLKQILEAMREQARLTKAMLKFVSGEALPSDIQREHGNDWLGMNSPDRRQSDQEPITTLRGIVGRLGTAQFMEGEKAVEMIGYRRGFQPGRLSSMYGWGELMRQAVVPFRPYGYPTAGEDGDRAAYSGGMNRISLEDQGKLYDPNNATKLHELGIINDKEYELSKVSKAEYRKDEKTLRTGPVAEALRKAREETYRKIVEKAWSKDSGIDISKALDDDVIGSAARSASGRIGISGRTGTAIFEAGGALMAGARAIAGPVAVAVQAAQYAYQGVDKLYGMGSRPAAALGYGFQTSPFSDASRTMMGRSFTTQLDALTSMGLSGAQTQAARDAVQGMGLGGRGQEKSYNEYYKSMVSTIENTQLGADVLAPFYEQFMRSGGQTSELDKLTKMLRDDLPKAAAASRMSLTQMAKTLQDVTDIAMQSPYNARTKTEIQQSAVNSFAFGAAKGTENIVAGTNAFVAAQAASNMGKGTSIFQAMQNPEQQQIAAVDLMMDTLGDMGNMSFAEFRQTDEGIWKTWMVERLTGLDVNTQAQIISQGPDDYRASQAMASRFNPNLSLTERTGKRIAGVLPIRGKAGKKAIEGREQFIIEDGKSTGINIYQSTGKEVQKYYQDDINVIKASLRDNPEELAKFVSDVSSNRGGNQGDEMRQIIRAQAERLAQTATQKGDGQIVLSAEARRFFELNFDSAPASNTNANEKTGTGQLVAPSRGTGIRGYN